MERLRRMGNKSRDEEHGEQPFIWTKERSQAELGKLFFIPASGRIEGSSSNDRSRRSSCSNN